MKKSLFLASVLFCSYVFAADALGKITLRAVLSEGDLNKKEYDVISTNSESLYVEKLPLLTEKNISKIVIRNTEDGVGCYLYFKFNEEGTNKLSEVTQKLIEKRMALFIGDVFLSAATIRESMPAGEMILTSPKSKVELEAFLKKNGVTAEHETVTYVYSEEQKKFSEIIKATLDKRESESVKEALDKGLGYLNKGKYDEAIGEFTRATWINRKCAEAYYNRGRAYFLKKDYSKASENIHKAEEFGYKPAPEFINELKKATGRN